jgi:TRAP-type C4-dicarboxylate transport system permease small subunit
MAEQSVPWIAMLRRVRLIVEKILSWIVAVLLVGMSLVVFTNVILRYFFGMTIGWYEELSRFLLIWIVFLGAVIAFFKGDHLSLDIVLKIIKPKARRVVSAVADLLVVAALLIMIQGGFAMALDSLASGWIASSIPIPYGYVYMVGPISAILMLLQALIKTGEDLYGLAWIRKGEA